MLCKVFFFSSSLKQLSYKPLISQVCSQFSILFPAYTSHQYRGGRQLFIAVDRLEPGKVKYEAVADAHTKDLGLVPAEVLKVKQGE